MGWRIKNEHTSTKTSLRLIPLFLDLDDCQTADMMVQGRATFVQRIALCSLEGCSMISLRLNELIDRTNNPLCFQEFLSYEILWSRSNSIRDLGWKSVVSTDLRVCSFNWSISQENTSGNPRDEFEIRIQDDLIIVHRSHINSGTDWIPCI